VAIFVTGATGYIGAHVAANLLDGSGEPLNLLVRAKNEQEARERLWRALQLHVDFPRFQSFLASRIQIFRGDLTGAKFGLAEDEYRSLARTTDSVIHCAASLNRKSEKVCMNVNLRGTLQVIELAMRARDDHGLRRTKKFSEHMVHELLPDVSRTIFRPSIVLGDSRRPETNQFEMVKAFAFLAGLPALPFRPADRVDIVPADYVASAIATLHLKENPAHEIYHLSSGADSETYLQLTRPLAEAQGKSAPVFLPSLERSTQGMVNVFSGRFGNAGKLATLLKVFLPYLTWNTVFDNSRIVAEMGRKPAPFSQYCFPLLKFSRANHFAYSYADWPRETAPPAPQEIPR